MTSGKSTLAAALTKAVKYSTTTKTTENTVCPEINYLAFMVVMDSLFSLHHIGWLNMKS